MIENDENLSKLSYLRCMIVREYNHVWPKMMGKDQNLGSQIKISDSPQMIFYRYWQFLPLLDMFHVPRSRLWLVHVDMKARNLQIEIMKLKMLKLTNLHLNKVLFPFPPLLPMTDIWNYCYFLSLFCQLYAELGNFPRYLVIFTQNLGIFKRNSANFMRFLVVFIRKSVI